MLEVLAFLTTLVWTIYSIQIIAFTIMSFLYRSKNQPVKAKNVSFVVVTIASEKVRGSLYYVLRGLARFERPVYVLVDEGAILLEELQRAFPYIFVVVPKRFRCKAIAKGRAMEYFTRNHVEDDRWYVFLDDDSLPLDDHFLCEITHRERLGYVAANGILYPRLGRNVYTYILDFYRFLDDVTIFRGCQGFLKTPLIGFHGELLIVKGSTAKEIGFDRRSLVEDFSFSSEVIRRGYKTWSSSTRVSIQSPNTLKDFLKQRARWFKGIMLDLRCAPLKQKLFWSYRCLLVALSTFGSIIFMLLWITFSLLGRHYIPFIPTFFVGSIYWIIAMFILPKASLHHKIIALFIAPVETIAPLYALRIKDFVVIDKN